MEHGAWHSCIVPGCNDSTWGEAPRRCNDCETKRAAARAVYDRAYFAALPMLAANEPTKNAVECASLIALETVRQWPAMQAEIDALIGEMG